MGGLADGHSSAVDPSRRLGFQRDIIQGCTVDYAVYCNIFLLVDIYGSAAEQIHKTAQRGWLYISGDSREPPPQIGDMAADLSGWICVVR